MSSKKVPPTGLTRCSYLVQAIVDFLLILHSYIAIEFGALFIFIKGSFTIRSTQLKIDL